MNHPNSVGPCCFQGKNFVTYYANKRELIGILITGKEAMRRVIISTMQILLLYSKVSLSNCTYVMAFLLGCSPADVKKLKKKQQTTLFAHFFYNTDLFGLPLEKSVSLNLELLHTKEVGKTTGLDVERHG